MPVLIKKAIFGIVSSCILLGMWFVYTELFTVVNRSVTAEFDVLPGDTAKTVAARLAQTRVIRHEWLFLLYARYRGIDRTITAGEYQVPTPVTIAHVVAALSHPGVGEETITIVPGWDLRDIAASLEQYGSGPEDFFSLVGMPAKETVPSFHSVDRVTAQKPAGVSFEGYLAPETYRVYKNAALEDIVQKVIDQRNTEFTPELYAEVADSGHTLHEILTMASLLEREVRGNTDRAIVADIFWRRLKQGWPLQADSTIHYAVGKNGTAFTSSVDREVDSPWNTYKYAGLPPGPICSPSVASIMAAIHPQKNEYWYFLTDSAGVVHYAKTNEEHNVNRAKNLR